MKQTLVNLKPDNHAISAKKGRLLTIPATIFFCAILIQTACAEEEIPLPPGIYRLEMIMASTTRVPFFGASKSASKSISLVEIRRDGADLIQNHRVCDFRVLEDAKFIKMIFPEKFIAALAKHEYPVQLKQDQHGWAYHADLGLERIGYRANGSEDKLPTKVEDPAVFDWDNDGHPGATLKISIPLLPAGELYVVQRGQSILTGRIVQPGKVEGGIEVHHFEQKVLGAWPGFLAKSPEIETDPKESRFSLSRVAAGSTCETLRAATAKR